MATKLIYNILCLPSLVHMSQLLFIYNSLTRTIYVVVITTIINTIFSTYVHSSELRLIALFILHFYLALWE